MTYSINFPFFYLPPLCREGVAASGVLDNTKQALLLHQRPCQVFMSNGLNFQDVFQFLTTSTWVVLLSGAPSPTPTPQKILRFVSTLGGGPHPWNPARVLCWSNFCIWTRPDPTRPAEMMTWPDPTRPDRTEQSFNSVTDKMPNLATPVSLKRHFNSMAFRHEACCR